MRHWLDLFKSWVYGLVYSHSFGVDEVFAIIPSNQWITLFGKGSLHTKLKLKYGDFSDAHLLICLNQLVVAGKIEEVRETITIQTVKGDRSQKDVTEYRRCGNGGTLLRDIYASVVTQRG